jgi:murein L,D-transpeptidase YcbB/YkuD
MMMSDTFRTTSPKAGAISVALAALVLAGASATAQSSEASKSALMSALGVSPGGQNAPMKAGADGAKSVVGETLILRDFYDKLEFRAIWFDDKGPTAKAKIFIDRLGRAGEHGLNPADYLYERLAKGVNSYDPAQRAVLEVMMSRAFARYAADINAGRIGPNRAVPGLYVRPVRPDPERLLMAAARTTDFAKYIDGLPPQTPQYARLVKALTYYRAIEARGGWQPVPKGPTLKPGMTNPRIAQIRTRLMVSGDLKAMGDNPNNYDTGLVAAVKRFQFRHGLNQDGNIGAGTVAAMNIPIAIKIRQQVLNLERRRWMPPDLGDQYIFVNIADQHLKYVIRANSSKPKTIFVSRVVVGQRFHQTPIFSGVMSYVRVNPHWNVPQSIARKEMLPKLKRDPSYLTRNNYLLLTRPIDNSSAISPSSVDWASMTRSNFPYFIRQTPGPWNALGVIIFMFPNPHNIFIHDTASRSLFVRELRYFSHGCIRIQHPRKFGELMLGPNPGWDRKRIDATVKTQKELQVNLRRRLPVHITYLTAWSNKDGTHHFRSDIYKRDVTLNKVLTSAIKAAKRSITAAASPGKSG